MKDKEGIQLHQVIGSRIKELREKRNLSLGGLAKRAGISKATLSVLEDGRGNPTISTLWALADALRIPFGELIDGAKYGSKYFISEEGFTVQLIEQCQGPPKIEAYHVTLESRAIREAESHPSGVVEQLFVLKGRILTGPADSPRIIKPGERLAFAADCPHLYVALSDPASAIIIITYPPKNKKNNNEK